MEPGIMIRLNDRESKILLLAITRVIMQGYLQVANATNKIGVNNAEWSFAGKACKEKEGTEQLSIKNGIVMELKKIKHFGASKDLAGS